MLLRRGVPIEAKPFQLGVRIEQPQAAMDRARYGPAAGHPALGAADYSASVRTPGRDLFTFCMCAGGYVMPSVSEPGYFCTNGMSESRHDSPFANSGLVVTIEPRETGSTHPLAGVHYQQRFERPGVRCRRRVVQGTDPVGPRFPRGPAQPGQAPDQLSPRHRADGPGPLLPEPVVEALLHGLAPHGSAIRRAIPPRRDAHRARGPRQLARPHHPRPANPAKSGRCRPLPVRRRGRLRRRNRQRGRRRRSDRARDRGCLRDSIMTGVAQRLLIICGQIQIQERA